jgi:hypothetical protein
MEVIFGKNTEGGELSYQALALNGLTLFPNIDQAKEAKNDIGKRPDFESIQIAEIQIKIAEQQKEFPLLHAKKNYIVVWAVKELGETRLIGKYVEGRPGQYPLPGTLLSLNGCRPILSFKNAIYIADEVNRQGGGIVYIGTIIIKKIK